VNEMLPDRFDDITADDILRLVADKVAEHKTLEYKATLSVSILRQSRRLYGCWPIKGAFSQPLKAKATATATAM